MVTMLFPLLFGSHDVNAWELTDPYFNPNQSLTLYRSYMEQAEGAPYIVNNEQVNNFTSSSYLIGPTSSSIQTKSLFSFKTAGYELSGDDSAAHYHSAQAVFYFIANNSSYIDFHNVPIFASYVLWDGGNNVKHQSANCTLSYEQESSAPYNVGVSIECPQVTYKGTGYEYTWVDLTVGDLVGNDASSQYFYRYRNGGGLKLSANIGQYIVSATDNASELALEQITVQNQTMINQNETIINQNQTIIDQDNQDRQDFQNQTNDSSDTADDLSDDVSNASSSLLVIIGNFVNIVLNPPQSDCNITLDVGNANFGQADLCRLSLPQPLAVIGTLLILGFIITFTVSLIMTFLSLLKGATQ